MLATEKLCLSIITSNYDNLFARLETLDVELQIMLLDEFSVAIRGTVELAALQVNLKNNHICYEVN